MLSAYRRRRARLITGVVAASAVLATMAFAGTAGATTYALQDGNHTIIGSGSSTTYYMMQQLDTLFNDSQGCQIFDPTGSNQPLDLSCANHAPGYVAPENLPASDGENPYNDIAVEEPYIGSSNGISQLKYQGSNNPSNSENVAPINFARSSRALKGTDAAGENFVAYAKDGVDWTTFSKVPNTKLTTTPSSCVPSGDLELPYLVDVWQGTISNWAELCADIHYSPATPTHAQYQSYAKYNAPICVYTAQDGSGTLSTWDSYLGITTENIIGTLTPNSTSKTWAQSVGLSGTPVNSGCTNGTSASQYGQTHQIFENETQQLVAQGAKQTGSGQYSDTIDSIFFYSFGRYSLQCKPGDAICEPTGFTVKLGEIGNQLPTEANIIATDKPGFDGNPWAVPRYLFNVYANGDTSAGLVPATPATVNYVSEVGFICKPQTQIVNNKNVPITDPQTGKSYLSEIEAAILDNGFFPLPAQASEDQGTINYPAVNLLPAYNGTGHMNDAYSIFDPAHNTALSALANATKNHSRTNPSGYCKVFSTSS